MQSQAVKPVTATNDMFSRAQVHHGMPADLNERVAAKPKHQLTQGIIRGKLLKHSMYPGPPIPAQYGDDLPTGQQPDLVAIYARDGQQLVDRISETHAARS